MQIVMNVIGPLLIFAYAVPFWKLKSVFDGIEDSA